jgi:hypothetical protein
VVSAAGFPEESYRRTVTIDAQQEIKKTKKKKARLPLIETNLSVLIFIESKEQTMQLRVVKGQPQRNKRSFQFLIDSVARRKSWNGVRCVCVQMERNICVGIQETRVRAR